MNLNDVMTSKEVLEEFGVAESTLRTECKKSLEGKGKFNINEIRKAPGSWLICRKAVERVYGPKNDKIE